MAATFHSMIEGRSGDTNIESMPTDLFSKMSKLHTIHFGAHESLTSFPSLHGLTNLISLTLVSLSSITNLTTFEGLDNIEVITLKTLRDVLYLPDLATLPSTLAEFDLDSSTPVCCSGYLTAGVCNTSISTCASDTSKCLTDTSYAASNASLKVWAWLETLDDAVCTDDTVSATTTTSSSSSSASTGTGGGGAGGSMGGTAGGSMGGGAGGSMGGTAGSMGGTAGSTTGGGTASAAHGVSQENIDTKCGGILYRECDDGMCINAHFAVIQCLDNDNYITVRQRQIAEGFASDCNKTYEAWLGCT